MADELEGATDELGLSVVEPTVVLLTPDELDSATVLEDSLETTDEL